MSSKIDERIPQYEIIFILVAMIAGSEIISSVVYRLLHLPKPYADGFGFSLVSLLIYWLPQVRRRRRVSLLQWIVISLLVGAVAAVLFYLIDAAYAHWF